MTDEKPRALILGIDPGLASLGWVIVELYADPQPQAGDLFSKGGVVWERVLDAGAILTSKTKKKSGVTKSEDQLRRIREQAEALRDVIRPIRKNLVAICAESQSWPHVPEMETTPFLERDMKRDHASRILEGLVAKLEDGELTPGELRRRSSDLAPPAVSMGQVEASLSNHARRTFGVLGASTMIAMSWGIVGCLGAILGVPVEQASPQRVRIELLGRRGGTKDQIEEALVERYGVDELAPILRLPKSKRNHASDAFAGVVACLERPILMRARDALTVEGDIDFG